MIISGAVNCACVRCYFSANPGARRGAVFRMALHGKHAGRNDNSAGKRSVLLRMRFARAIRQGIRIMGHFPSSFVRSQALITASIQAARKAFSSSARTPAMVEPAGLHTASFSAPG